MIRSRGQWLVTSEWPSAERIFVCVLAAAGIASVGFSLVFAGIAVRDGSSAVEVLLVGAMMTYLWGPLTLWSVWYVFVPGVLVGGVLAAAVTHGRERTWPTGWLWVGRICLVILILGGVWTMVVGGVVGIYGVTHGGR